MDKQELIDNQREELQEKTHLEIGEVVEYSNPENTDLIHMSLEVISGSLFRREASAVENLDRLTLTGGTPVVRILVDDSKLDD